MAPLDSHDCAAIDVPLVKRLVADQFPNWADLAIVPVTVDGHDNRTFRLGDEMSVRVPGTRQYAAHVPTEQEWLPKLAPHLPLPIPTPLALGKPTSQLPWHWSVNRWLQGDTVAECRIDDLTQLARDLATFLTKLRAIDAKDAPPPGPVNFFRGGDLSVYDGETRGSIDELRERVDVRAATAVWDSALETTWISAPVWIHGDVAAGNLLVDRGKLSGVIDFGQLAAGDPACEVTIAWTLFAGESREAFRREIALDEATWTRGRGWGLWKAMLELRRHRDTDPPEGARWQRVIDEILSD
ncbi:MAG TPA: aminoglycoside phosphotransferase family protein [Pirellulales bacterium]|jgi:aminoglycoside phosphotransferase (APT) family kinase protein|nr:aminoglycoside phosphotransferase family protein [Pirellulales bacterium]